MYFGKSLMMPFYFAFTSSFLLSLRSEDFNIVLQLPEHFALLTLTSQPRRHTLFVAKEGSIVLDNMSVSLLCGLVFLTVYMALIIRRMIASPLAFLQMNLCVIRCKGCEAWEVGGKLNVITYEPSLHYLGF